MKSLVEAIPREKRTAATGAKSIVLFLESQLKRFFKILIIVIKNLHMVKSTNPMMTLVSGLPKEERL